LKHVFASGANSERCYKKKKKREKTRKCAVCRVSAVAARVEGAVLLVSAVVKNEKALKKEQEMR
jgi:hypothetical protein